MTADVIRFPARRGRCIWVLTENEGEWIVLAGENGWLHGDLFDAIADAQWMSTNCGLPIRLKETAP
jgi:hypothetical protein